MQGLKELSVLSYFDGLTNLFNEIQYILSVLSYFDTPQPNEPRSVRRLSVLSYFDIRKHYGFDIYTTFSSFLFRLLQLKGEWKWWNFQFFLISTWLKTVLNRETAFSSFLFRRETVEKSVKKIDFQFFLIST